MHGVLPGRKEEGITWLMYENTNGLSNRMGGNDKLGKAKDLIDKLEADIELYNEHRKNLMHSGNCNGWSQLFRGGEADVRSVVAHNIHKGRKVGRAQEGGTGILMFSQLTEPLDMPNSGKDESDLGRWSMMVIKGEGVQTRIICSYNPCNIRKTDSSISYQQHCRYLIMHKKDAVTCLRVKFWEDLIHLLKIWREAGDQIIVCLDASKNIYSKTIGKALLEEGAGLDMKEVVGEFTGKKIGPTPFQGQLPIDGIWATTNITVTNACIMPTWYAIGDHPLFIIDIHTSSLIGTGPLRMQQASSRWLHTRLPHIATKYNKSLEESILRHHLIGNLGEAHSQSNSVEEIQSRINEIDQQSKQYMKHTEITCRKLKSGRICFSPELVIWIK